MSKKIGLASNSERRQQLLKQIHVDFDLLLMPDHINIELDATQKSSESAPDYALRLAIEKNHAARLFYQIDRPILTADTIVSLNNQALEKPCSQKNAKAMLGLLSGQTHEVITAVAISMPGQSLKTCIGNTQVTFKHLTNEEIDRYLTLCNVMDKAGSYAIQEYAALFISHISGSYSNVVGLPLFETGIMLESLDILTTKRSC